MLARPEMKAMFLDDIIGNTRRGMRAPVSDLILFTQDWGFSLQDVDVPVRWWHGDSDHIVPLAHGRHVVARLPDASLTVRPGEGHLGGFGAAVEVLGTLLDLWATQAGVTACRDFAQFDPVAAQPTGTATCRFIQTPTPP